MDRQAVVNSDSYEGPIGVSLSRISWGLFPPETEKKMYWWGFPSIGLGAVNQFVSMFLLYYYNQILGLSAALVGLALFISVVFDAVSDPLIAYWSDRYQGEFGRRIPFMFAAIVPMSLSLFALFALNLGDADWILFSQLTVLIVVFRVSQTLFFVPRMALGVELYKDYTDRNRLISAAEVFALAGISLCMAPILLLMPDWDQAHLYPWAALWVSFLLGWSAFMGTSKLSAVEKNSFQSNRVGKAARFSWKQLGREAVALFSNKNWMTLLFAFLFFSLNGGIQGGDSIYFNNHLFKFSPSDLFWSGPLMLGGSLVAALLVSKISKGQDKRRLVIISGSMSFVIAPLLLGLMAAERYFGYDFLPEAGDGVLSPLWWLWAFHGFLNGGIWIFFIILVQSMFADVVEEHQAKTNSRSDGLVLVGSNLVTKLVGSVGVLLAGVIIKWAGFDDASSLELKEVAVYNLAAIKVAVSLLLVPLGLLCLTRYTLSAEQHLRNLRNLGYEKEI